MGGSQTSRWRVAPASRRRRACAGCGCWRKPGTSWAITPELEPKHLGFNVTVFAQVGLSSQAEPDLDAFEHLVGGWPEVRECHMLAGETDFLLKVVAEDWDAYQRFLTTQLTAAPNVSHVKSALSIRGLEVGARRPHRDRRAGYGDGGLSSPGQAS